MTFPLSITRAWSWLVLALAFFSPSGAPVRAAAREADDTEIRIAEQATDGGVWAIGARDGPAVYRWSGERWEKRAGWEEWPGNVIEMAADPSRPDAVLSVWFGVPGDGGQARTLQLWRHTAREPARRVVAFPNPTAQDATWGRSWPRLGVDPAGGAWLTFAAPVVLRVSPEGGAPKRIELPLDAFTPLAGKQITEILPLLFFADGAGSGWLWSSDDDRFPSGRGVLFRPLRIVGDGPVEAAATEGLPAEGRVVMVRRDHAGRMVWALEGKGLWRVEADGHRAEPVDSPPGAWRILDWKDWPDGRAIALVFAKEGRADRQRGEIWTRAAGGWTNLGRTGDTSSRILRVNDWVSAPRDWFWGEDRLLGAGFHVGLVVADMTGNAPRCRALDWRDGQDVAKLRRLFPLPDGRLLLQGATSAAVSVGELWAGKARADAAAARGEAPVALTFPEDPVRAPDGRLWILRTRGAGAPAVGHWDGAHWLEWPLPRERTWWPDDALWVDASGRVAVFSDDLERPAWELGAHGADWRRWPSGKALIQARIAEPARAATLPRVESQPARAPVLSSDGRVLVGTGGGDLWYLADGAWMRFGRTELGTTASRFGFSEDDGRPWFYFSGRLRRLASDGRWTDEPGRPEAKTMRQEQERRRGSHADDWEAALGARVPARGRVTAAHPDATGAWWAVVDGGLWRVEGNEALRIFDEDEPTPFRQNRGWWFNKVLADSRGDRLFVGSPYVLLPALAGPEIDVRWRWSDGVRDLAADVQGAGLAFFEWRLDDGAWRRESGRTLGLRELAPGAHRLEVRGLNRRLDAGPAIRIEPRAAYDREARVRELLGALNEPARRADAVRRLAAHGGAAARVVRNALEREADEDRRWWLRAALQGIADRDQMKTTPTP